MSLSSATPAAEDWWRSNDGVPPEITTDVERLIGRPGRTFATWAQEHAAAFTR
ncbi:hypothetical protein ACTWPT_08030 [Nonomuraea sp. 3N208]|uniref:hypothetical protein n=1 Tax=Nonomuraea sp. 3N208 TaxID=3457421 RepID=UPI003FCD6FD8